LLWLYLESETNLFSEKLTVLHFAPEQCFLPRLKSMSNLKYITADLESPLAMVKVDITSLPFQNSSVDVILCNHLLEHVEDDRKAMREMCRVLSKNGWAIIQPHIDARRQITFEDPSVTSPEDRERLFNQRDHIRVYGSDYTKRLEEAGLRVHTKKYLEDGNDEGLKKFAFPANREIYLCKRA
jgi:SAM-dependent methyltransferase